MRKVIVFISLILILCNASAQQRPHYSQYLQNMSVLNPAVTGVNSGMDLRLGMRTQWQGFEGAPKTGYVSFSTPVSFGGDLATYRGADLGVTEPETKDDMFDYSASMSHHSFGALFLSDKTGPLSRITGNVTYAYHISIGETTNLSVGVGVGANRLGINGQSLVFEELGDGVVGTSSQINKYTPDLNAGLYYYGSNFYVGASMQQIIKNKIAFDGDFNVGKEVAHYFVAAGYQFWINNDFSVTPSVMLKVVNPLPKAFDLSMKFAYRNNFWIGGGYRKNDAFFGNIGFNVAKMVGVNYAYDYTTSKLRNSSSGSHELALRVLF
ncbi:type IX secretion system membrane protein PorP/SprF [Pedobacter xixiisoli]|uniref:Type IX secretion system membrane protein, PorP/SprF family n=1 Tax=Pedobacter xixiisoli TaxID=1476464 RepID=A0A285ZXQ9_9SPHI|nr:type IX secretion system membrane protein PorP/SprF [Pedobacter xixiisoli]SOD14443.1 type IX secretion system membrane protein, PorP/SprF family [Pedobacter xixiisoli]